MVTPSSFQTDSLIAEDIDAYLKQHQHKSPIDHRLSAPQSDDSRVGRLCAAGAGARGIRSQGEEDMIGRVIWFAAILGLAVATAGVQLDRQVRRTPQIASAVPEPFRSAAQFEIARAALEGDDPEYAVAEARRLVLRRPMPSEHLTILAIASIKAGRPEAGAETIQYAARRGWRDPLAQEGMLRLAIAADDIPEAALRYTALMLSEDSDDAFLTEFAPRIFAETGGAGQQIMVDTLVSTDRWPTTFIRRGGRVMPPAIFVDIVAASIARGVRYDCKVLQQAIRPMSRRDADAAARLAAAAEKQC